ncbi:MAG: DMT family transporter [Rhodobacteraceae bacterium]|jgi:drug/metabolite transporter (DMT)-like permease|nr:DMT family transporter [Paracoccaceae bacterium]
MKMDAFDWVMLITLATVWGGSFLFNAILVAELPVITIVAIRVTVAALALWGFVRVTGRKIPTSPQVWGALLILGVLNNAIPFSLIVQGQTQITSGLASILNATTPLFTILVAGFFLTDERFSVLRVLGVVVGFSGVILMVGPEALSGLGDDFWAQLCALGAALSYGFASVFGRRFRELRVDPVMVATGQVTMSSLVLWPIALWIDGPQDIMGLSFNAAASMFGLAVLCTSFAYILYFRILERAGATNISLVTFLVPISAIILGVLVLGERIFIKEIMGMTLIGMGLAIIDGRLFQRLRD